MNPELQKELATWLMNLREAADAGASFVLEQAPLIVQEKVAYGRVMHTASVVAFLLLAVAATYVALRFYKAGQEDDWENILHVLGFMLAAIAVPASFASAIESFGPCVMAWFAPRLYVLEWLAGIVKA
jgi:hypothetical protein